MRPDVIIRPLERGDAAQVQQFVRGLSLQSRRERYFSAINELSDRELERITAPQRLNLGAFDAHGTLLGIAECEAGELGVVVADAWQGSGLGRRLLQRLVAQAARQRVPRLHGLVRAGNRTMLRLAASFGFRAARDADPDLVRITLF
ncbi:MAG TPA: GNAT family N-acetyltransferase [Burkholderiales bacterium]|nr:GNAT family N-acetyltransferase [Burkholderiales bacterium]